MDSKATTTRKGCKEDQSVAGCCNYSFPYSLSAALRSRHSRNSSPSLSPLFLQPRSFCLWQGWTTNTPGFSHSFSGFSILRNLDLPLAETTRTAERAGRREQLQRLSVQPPCERMVLPALSSALSKGHSEEHLAGWGPSPGHQSAHGPTCMKISSRQII